MLKTKKLYSECFNGCFLLEKVSNKACSGTTSNPIIQPRLAEYIVCASLTKLLTLEIVSDREGNCHNLYYPCNNKMLLIQKHLLQKKEKKKKIGSRFVGLSSRMVMIRKNQMHLFSTQYFLLKTIFKYTFTRLKRVETILIVHTSIACIRLTDKRWF